MKLRYKILNEMVEKGYTQAKLARQTKINRSTICRILTGVVDSPSLKTIYRLCHVLDMSIDELIKDTEIEEEFK